MFFVFCFHVQYIYKQFVISTSGEALIFLFINMYLLLYFVMNIA